MFRSTRTSLIGLGDRRDRDDDPLPWRRPFSLVAAMKDTSQHDRRTSQLGAIPWRGKCW
jgi:hypothetical protein